MGRNAVLVVIAVALAAVAGVILVKAPPQLPGAKIGNGKPEAAKAAPAGNGAPTVAFDDQPHPPAPDYAQVSAWAALPDRKDAADLVPADNAFPDGQANAAVDVFYIHPTTFRSTTQWVQDIADAETNAWTDVSVIARQAAIFNACCKIYAPRYRQATIGALGGGASGPKAYAFAYEDVKRAFAYYVEHFNRGRPFILVGHSQGTFHLLPLLEQMVDPTPLKDRLVAAYAIGIGVPVGTFGRALKNLRTCDTPDQTGCVASWNTYGRGGSAAATNTRAEQRYVQRFGTEEGKAVMCVNPLTFSAAQPDAPATANLGALPGVAAEGPLAAVKPGLVGATCRDGGLYADIPTDPDFVLTVLPGEVLHMHDMDLFFQNIRANAVLRTEAWLKAHPPG
jgi:hypothetical protein